MNPSRDRIPVSERLLIEALSDPPAQSALCTSLGRGQIAGEASRRWPMARVVCHFLDLYRAEQAERSLSTRGSCVDVVCTADFPDQDYDLAAIPCTARGDGELARDQLQSAFQQLSIGGKLLVASDNPRDTWLGELMDRLTRKVGRFQSRTGVVYLGIKTEPLRKIKDYSCQFAFRDGSRLVHAFSRPGVFSHRRLDLGARALIESMEVRDGQHILELGCGAGVVSLAAALRSPEVRVTAIDANPRAIACTLRGAELNGRKNIETVLNADAACEVPHTYDLVLANPPYFSHFRIGEIFVRGAERALKSGGVLLLVTKQPEPYLTLVKEAGFHGATVSEVRKYSVLRALAKS
jgi:16S rRNA G1207 methylase RsmC